MTETHRPPVLLHDPATGRALLTLDATAVDALAKILDTVNLTDIADQPADYGLAPDDGQRTADIGYTIAKQLAAHRTDQPQPRLPARRNTVPTDLPYSNHDAYMVIQGQYDVTLAVFDVQDTAQAWADAWNLLHVHDIASNDDKAKVVPIQHFRVREPVASQPLTPGQLQGLAADINLHTGASGSTPEKVAQFLPMFLAAIGVQVQPQPAARPVEGTRTPGKVNPDCFENRDERGDCFGDPLVVEQRSTNLGVPRGTVVVMCTSHARQAAAAGEIRHAFRAYDPDFADRLSGGAYARD